MGKISEALHAQKKKAHDVEMDIAETCHLVEFKEHHKNTHHEGGTTGNGDEEDEDDDHHHGGQRVRCNQ